QAESSRYVLKPKEVPGYLALNQAIVAKAAELSAGGQPLLLLKPTASVPHGGQQVVAPESAELAVLIETLKRVADPVVCPGDEPDPSTLTDGVTLLDAFQTLHKASLQLASRPPTDAEIAAVDAGGVDALPAIIAAQLKEPAFEERLREIFSDVLLTDGFRANNTVDNTGNIVNDYYPSGAVDYWGGENWAWRSWPNGEGIRLVEALAREPVEFVVHAFRAGAPLSTILTAPYRLLNAYSARFFKVPYKGFAPGTPFDQIPDPTEYVEVSSVPVINEKDGSGEYAGILTTSSFLLRYPSSPTNFNRKRARFTYKYFLAFDIMKSAPRIDASAVDLNDTPTLKNEQCTGCHSQIDPVAGMFQNQDECGYDDAVYYQPPGSPKNNACDDAGWVPATEMFPPGVAPAPAEPLALEDRPRALEALAAHIVSQPAFADAMTLHVYSALIGRRPLQAPADPTQPGFAELDAAATYEASELARLSTIFQESGQQLGPLIVAIVMSPTFRAAAADKPGRVELVGLGGGVLTTPENLNRKITATTGVIWQVHGATAALNTGYQRVGRHDRTNDAYLLLREQLKTLYGGMDGSFQGVKTRQTEPSTLTAAIVEHMALEVSCLATARDFDKAPAERLLFPDVSLSLLPSGDPSAADQAPIVKTLQRLHRRLLGEHLEADAPELLASYALLTELQQQGAARIAAGQESEDLERPCSTDIDVATGVVSAGMTTDPTYVIRAWQGLLSYLLMDDHFVLEL
ncbi:MAG: hypothetical protein IV100_33130, partial [Myxococcales bacterium]|nr:hypothetical protein [Myxococcales bacterium]